MRIILDTNVMLSALLVPLGAPAKLIDPWERKLFTLVACDELIAEFREVAGRPFFKQRLRAGVVELLTAGIRDFAFYCHDLPSEPVAPDPKDSYLLALAEVSAADFLVTGDKELQSMKHYKSTRIVSPAKMMDFLMKAAEKGRDA
jgi:putative PIN family toxin of toxin-antitoxin system